MGYLEILFRNTSNNVPFKNSLGKLISSEGVYLVITSGYFGNLAIDTSNRDFFENAFKNWIDNSVGENFYMDFYGGQKSKYKKDDNFNYVLDNNGGHILDENYIHFRQMAIYFKELGERICLQWNRNNNGNKVFLMRAGYSSCNFHAKMAMKFQSFDYYNSLMQVIIGSSNLTKPAFTSPYSYHNFESDIYMYKKKELLDTTKVENHIKNDISKDDVLAFKIEDNAFEYIGEEAINYIYNMREDNKMEILDL